jgi:hypothetical protein
MQIFFEKIFPENLLCILDYFINVFGIIINNKNYPPKEIFRIAAEIMNYEIIETNFAGGHANKPFERLGYNIKNKNQESRLPIEFLMGVRQIAFSKKKY